MIRDDDTNCPSWTERRARLIPDGEEATVWTPETIEQTWDDPNCLVRQLLRDLLAARSEVERLREREKRLVDAIKSYMDPDLRCDADETLIKEALSAWDAAHGAGKEAPTLD